MEVPEASYRARSTYSLFQNEQDTHVVFEEKETPFFKFFFPGFKTYFLLFPSEPSP